MLDEIIMGEGDLELKDPYEVFYIFMNLIRDQRLFQFPEALQPVDSDLVRTQIFVFHFGQVY